MSRETIWVTAAGDEMMIKDMDDKHIGNTIRLLGRKILDGASPLCGDIQRIMITEAMNRGLTLNKT